MKKNLSVNEIALNARRQWSFNPATRIVKSKKQYSRKNKSWKSEF